MLLVDCVSEFTLSMILTIPNIPLFGMLNQNQLVKNILAIATKAILQPCNFMLKKANFQFNPCQ
jgi:hypothetical protein